MPLKRLLVLVAHEPNQDPRIDWVSRFATNLFHVTVRGIKEPTRPESSASTQHGYEIERHQRDLIGWKGFIFDLIRCIARNPFSWMLALTMLIISGPFLVFFVAYKLTRKIIRIVTHSASVVISLPIKILRNLLRRVSQIISAARRILDRLEWRLRYLWITSVTLYRSARAGDRPDLIYCNDLDTLLAGVVLRWYFGCKLVYDAHEFWAHAYPDSSWAEVNIFVLYERQLVVHVDAAYTVNHLLAEQMTVALGRYYGSLPNCEPLYSIEKLHRQSDSRVLISNLNSVENTTLKSVTEIAEGRVRFLFQGLFAPERGIEELLKVWTSVDASQAVLFLRGPDSEYKTPCVELARDLGILNRSVFFLDPVREYDLVPAAAEAEIGIIPYKAATINYRYCCPNKLSQYMQAGLAILANDLDFVKYTIDRFQCGLTYNVNDPPSCLAAINRFIIDESFRRDCQKRAKDMFVQEYNWECQSKSLYETCARLAGIKESTQVDEANIARAA